MTTLNLENIQNFLHKKKYDANIQAETKQVYTVLKLNEREFPLFFRIFEEGNLLQLLAFFPCQITAESRANVARLLHLFNKELDVPGFGMDEVMGVVFFRCMIPTSKQKLDEPLVETFIHTVELACKTFSQTIEAIAANLVDLDDMIKKAQEQAEKKRGA